MTLKDTHRPGKLAPSGHSLSGGARPNVCGMCMVDFPRHVFDFLPWERSRRLISCVGVRGVEEAPSGGQTTQKKAEDVPLAQTILRLNLNSSPTRGHGLTKGEATMWPSWFWGGVNRHNH